MDLHLTLFLAVFFASIQVIFFFIGELVLHPLPPGLLWGASSSEPLRVPLKDGMGDAIVRLPKHMLDPFPLSSLIAFLYTTLLCYGGFKRKLHVCNNCVIRHIYPHISHIFGARIKYK